MTGGAGLVGAVFNLNHPAKAVHWHFFQMSVANILVIILMFVVFFAGDPAPVPRAAAGAPRAGRRGAS